MITGVTTPADQQLPGRALIEGGGPVAGSMTTAAAAVVFDPAGAAVQLDEWLAACLRAAAREAAELAAPREQVRAGAALAFAVEHGVALARAGRPPRGDAFFTGRDGNRAAAATVAEAVVGAARRSAEERRGGRPGGPPPPGGRAPPPHRAPAPRPPPPA